MVNGVTIDDMWMTRSVKPSRVQRSLRRRRDISVEIELNEVTDGNELAGSGFHVSLAGNFPRGLEQCPLPDIVVVHFPAYAGPALRISRVLGCQFHARRSGTRGSNSWQGVALLCA